MINFKFLKNINFYKPSESFIAVVDSTIRNKEELLKDLCTKLQLPAYFGYNWDALLDTLRDLHWINNNTIIIVHEEVPNILETELKTYLEILEEAVSYWEADVKRDLEIIFPESSRNALESLLRL